MLLSTRLLVMTVLARLVALKTNILLSLWYKLHQVIMNYYMVTDLEVKLGSSFKATEANLIAKKF